jgi:hypothetical protein
VAVIKRIHETSKCRRIRRLLPTYFSSISPLENHLKISSDTFLRITYLVRYFSNASFGVLKSPLPVLKRAPLKGRIVSKYLYLPLDAAPVRSQYVDDQQLGRSGVETESKILVRKSDTASHKVRESKRPPPHVTWSYENLALTYHM